MTTFESRLRSLIGGHGPISVARFMALALGHPEHGYYTTRDPLGRSGDFVTAPEISQTFGELLGVAFAKAWLDMERPSRVHLVEFGPGRGTLIQDLLRAAGSAPGFRSVLDVHLVETSPVLRHRQRTRLANVAARWYADESSLPTDAPLFVVANEFLDALPVRQFERTAAGWRERLVATGADGRLGFVLGRLTVPLDGALGERAQALPLGSVVEIAPAREAFASMLAGRLVRQGGMALLIDYGDTSLDGDTLQAVRGHRKVDPLQAPGETDLTTHVDFGALARAARAAGATVHGPVPQGLFLQRLGIAARLERLLAGADADRAAALVSGVRRLVEPAQMGELFKVMALSGPDMPQPAGFLAEERRA